MRLIAPLPLTLTLLLAAPARADDWLAVQPECAYGPEVREPGRMALLYPRVGLSAVVSAGEALVARVRVPSGLTPPPGIQQERALVGWSAELVGQSVALGERAEHRYALPVVDVRPDGVSSLVYRATIPIPAWAAPGTYGLVVRAPGGEDGVAGAVRVLARGRAIRVALFGGPTAGTAHGADGPTALAALAVAPVDAVVGPIDRSTLERLASAPLDARVPAYVALPRDGPGVAAGLLVEEHIVLLGECEPGVQTVATEADALARRDGIETRALTAAYLPPPGTLVLLDDPARPIRFDVAPSAIVDDDALRIEAARSRTEHTVRVPDDGRAVAVDGAMRADVFPATYLGAASSIPSLAIRIVVASGRDVAVRRAPREPLELTLRAEPRVVPTGETVTFTARADRPLARVAWTFSDGETAVGGVVRRSFGPVEAHEAHALAIGEDGTTAQARTTVEVRTREVRGCSGGSCSAAPGPRPEPSFWLLAAAVVGRGRRRGNGSPAPHR